MKLKSFFLFLLLMTFPLAAKIGTYEEIIDHNELQIRTPSLACRTIAKIRLDNGLKALLISDPAASQSAAALAMEVGSWSDPIEYPGMAHFTEHLLFMASNTYPEENGYFKQVTNNGGMLNAFTTSDRTVYMFTVNHDAFPATFDYFSHMFIDPLFSQSGIGRELHAVDQEHDKNIENDAFREYMILKETGNPHHPNTRFATGNAKTLGGIPRKEVIKWHQENYSADKAHLVVYASLPLEELKSLTVNYFSTIPSSIFPRTSFPEKLTSSKQYGSMTYITPVKEIRELSVYWELPQNFMRNIEDKSDVLLSYILNSRHPGSLYSRLKHEELIDSMYAGCHSFSKESGFYAVDFTLTPHGVNQTDRICEYLFQTLNTLKEHGIPSYIFEETKNMAKIDYEYQGRIHPFEFVMNTAYRMVEEPLQTFPQKLTLPTEYDPDKCAHLLNYLNPHQAQYNLKAPPTETGISGDRKEKWSGAQYTICPIDELQLAAWTKVKLCKNTIYPKQNPFIPINLQLVTNKRVSEETPLPELLVDNEYGRVYYWEDGQYLVPEISWIIAFRSPYIDRTPQHIVLSSLYEKCFNDHLLSTAYYADAASLTGTIKNEEYKFIIYINGFSEKAPVLLETMLNGLGTCHWTKEEFELQRSLLITEYENFRKMPPISQGADLMKNILFNNFPRKEDELRALEELSYTDFLNFKALFLQQAYAEVMLTGNLTKENAYDVWETLQDELNYLPYPKDHHIDRSYLVLSPHLGPYKLHEKIEALGHGAMLIIQEGPFSFEMDASATVLAKCLSEDFFDTLRTKQQTAYIARSAKVDDDGQLFQFFFVQSSTHQPDELIARFELFLEDYVKDFESKISEGEFENIRANLITTTKQPPHNLVSMANRLYLLGFKYNSDFHYIDKKTSALANLDYDTFKKNSICFLSRSNSKRIAILLEGKPLKTKSFCYKDITAEELKKSGAYVTSKSTQ